jgi:hypothetical protein
MTTRIRLNQYWTLEIDTPRRHLQSISGVLFGQVNGYPFIKYDRYDPKGNVAYDWPEKIPNTIKNLVKRKLNAYMRTEVR